MFRRQAPQEILKPNEEIDEGIDQEGEMAEEQEQENQPQIKEL